MVSYSVIVVEPKTGGNIGAIARSMANFGLKELILVNPKELGDEAYTRAMHAQDILDNAVIVENFEVFLHVDELLPALDAALYAAGRLSRRTIEWLTTLDDAQILHMGDYDPVGLDEYLRLRQALGPRVTLHIPTDLDDFEDRVRRYGRPDLLQTSADLLATVRRRADPAVNQVLEILDRHGKALEQEALLI